MKYIKKSHSSEILSKNLTYNTQSHRPRLREILTDEQKGFCAYSEKHFQNIDSVHIEHFDGRLKSTDEDNYFNWYAVLGWMNLHKPKNIEPFLPILHPHDPEVEKRLKLEDNQYKTTHKNDHEAQNLINYLGLNRVELCIDRKKHIDRIKMLLSLLMNDIGELKKHLTKNKESLSFRSALESELEIEI